MNTAKMVDHGIELYHRSVHALHVEDAALLDYSTLITSLSLPFTHRRNSRGRQR